MKMRMGVVPLVVYGVVAIRDAEHTAVAEVRRAAVAEAHGGRISATSEVSVGSTFALVLSRTNTLHRDDTFGESEPARDAAG